MALFSGFWDLAATSQFELPASPSAKWESLTMLDGEAFQSG